LSSGFVAIFYNHLPAGSLLGRNPADDLAQEGVEMALYMFFTQFVYFKARTFGRCRRIDHAGRGHPHSQYHPIPFGGFPYQFPVGPKRCRDVEYPFGSNGFCTEGIIGLSGPLVFVPVGKGRLKHFAQTFFYITLNQKLFRKFYIGHHSVGSGSLQKEPELLGCSFGNGRYYRSVRQKAYIQVGVAAVGLELFDGSERSVLKCLEGGAGNEGSLRGK